MAGNIKGITVEIGADTTKLKREISGIGSTARKLASELRDVEKSLKLDPKNADLTKQKFNLLGQEVQETDAKLKELQRALSEADKNGVDKNTAGYRLMQREIVQTTAKLKELTFQQKLMQLQGTKFGQINAKFEQMRPKIQSAGNAMMKLTKTAIGLGTAFAAFSLTKAFSKLTTIDEVQAKLKTLGYQGKELQSIMDSATESVSGTAHGLADMAKVIPGALGAGVDKTSYGLQGYLTRVADLSTFAGKNVSEFGTLMNKALSSGRADARLLNQFMYAGIPIYNDLAKALDVDVAKIKEMTKAGEIGMDDLMKATERYNGMAVELGMSTLTGAGTILSQTFGNIGVAFLEGVYEPMKEGLISLVKWLKSNMDTIKEYGKAFGDAISYLIKYAKDGETSMNGLSSTAQNIASVFKPLVGIVSTIVKWFASLSTGSKELVAGLALLSGPLLKLTSGAMGLYNTIFDIASKKIATKAAKAATGELTGLSSILSKLPGIAKLAGGAFGVMTLAVTAAIKQVDAITRANDEFIDSCEQEIDASQNAGMEAEIYADKIEELASVEHKSAGQKQLLAQYVDRLNEIVPDLNLKYDEQKDKLSKTNEQIRDQIELLKEQALAEAYATQAKKVANKLVQDQMALEQKQAQYNANKKEGQNLDPNSSRAQKLASENAQLRLEMNQLEGAIAKNEAKLDEWNQKSANITAFANLEKKAQKAGVDIPNSLKKGIQNGDVEIPKSIAELKNAVNLENKFQDIKKKANASGVSIPKNLASGMRNGKVEIPKSVSALKTLIKWGDLKTKAKSQGLTIPKGLAKGISNGKYAIPNSVNDLKKQIKLYKAGELEPQGEKTAKDFAKGVSKSGTKATTAGKDVAGKAKKGAGSVKFNSAGLSASLGFASGIRSGQYLAISAGSSLGRAAYNAAKRAIESRSPSKKFMELGRFASEGFALGITQKQGDAVSSAKKMANAVAGATSSAIKADVSASAKGSTNATTYNIGDVTLDVSKLEDVATIEEIFSVIKRAKSFV